MIYGQEIVIYLFMSPNARHSSLLVLPANHTPDVGDLPQVLTLFDEYVTQDPRAGYAREPRVVVSGLHVRRIHLLQVRQGGLSHVVDVGQHI